MGRKQGGARTGTPGQTYSNRSDLNTNRTPLTAFRNQPYGTGVHQAAVENAARTPALPSQPTQAPTPQAGPAPSYQPLQPGQHPVPPGVPAPGEFPPLLGPTERPNEPVTAGLPFGPGPNSLPQPFRPDPMAQAKAVLSTVPAAHMTPQLAALRNALTVSANNANNMSVQAPQ